MPKKKAKIIDRDLGWHKLQREIQKTKRSKPHVVVGVFGSEAAKDHGGIPNIQVAAAHELGARVDHPGGTAYIKDAEGNLRFVSNAAAEGQNLPRTKPHVIEIPRRSFLRDTIDQRKRRIARFIKVAALKNVDGEISAEQALEMTGLFVQGEIRKRISRGIAPRLKPATIRRKGSTKPLIDTGQLRGSISYKVRTK